MSTTIKSSDLPMTLLAGMAKAGWELVIEPDARGYWYRPSDSATSCRYDALGLEAFARGFLLAVRATLDRHHDTD